MQINYDIEKINDFLLDFCSITGLTVSVWDTKFNRLAYQPTTMADFCALVRTSPIGTKKCLVSDRETFEICKNSLSPAKHRCHAGLFDTAIPIIAHSKLVGYIMFGQIQGNDNLQIEHFEKLGNDLSLPAKELYEAYKKLNVYDEEKINSAARILTSTLSYLFVSGSIKYKEHELITAIDEFIDENIAQPIAVKDICIRFGISKTRLYSLYHSIYGETIGKKIMDRRMEMAQQLLQNSNHKINVICEKVGISDYNYFTKLYKKYYGYPPSKEGKYNLLG